jgi:hypothetical protein
VRAAAFVAAEVVMSKRIVVLGPVRNDKMLAREITPLDAGAFLASQSYRTHLSLLNGPLADATVIQRVLPFESMDESTAKGRAESLAWEMIEMLTPLGRTFLLDVPLTLAEYGS